MNEILIKHSVLPGALNNSQLNDFRQALWNAEEGVFRPFEDFLSLYTDKLAALTAKKENIRLRAAELSRLTLRAIENALPAVEGTMLSAFSQLPDVNELTSRHQKLMLELWEINASLGVLVEECALSPAPDEDVKTRLTLYKAALCEAVGGGELYGKYCLAEKTLTEAESDSLLDLGGHVCRLSDELKALCEKADVSFCAVTERAQSYAVYLRILSSHTLLINDLSAVFSRP